MKSHNSWSPQGQCEICGVHFEGHLELQMHLCGLHLESKMVWNLSGVHQESPESRVPHGYGNTHGVSKMGSAGMGTVVDFGKPQYTATRTRGITGIHGLNLHQRQVYLFVIIIINFSYFLFDIGATFERSLKLMAKHRHCISSALSPPPPPPPQTSSHMGSSTDEPYSLVGLSCTIRA